MPRKPSTRLGTFILFTIISALLVPVCAQAVEFSEQQIIKATWMMYSWRVLGYQYDGPRWTKGSDETGHIGGPRRADVSSDVRAVCLGAEEDWYVFLTLRSFVDPSFPSLVLQRIDSPPVDPAGQPFSEQQMVDESYIRYGQVSLARYDDVGGLQRVANKASGVTHWDRGSPKHGYGRPGPPWWSWSRQLPPDLYETIDNVQYERPHQDITAREHLAMQSKPQVGIRYVSDHDIALLYVPKDSFADASVETLGLANPTMAVRLLLEHQQEIFGFRFVLIGQETFDLITEFYPEDTDESALRGYKKLLGIGRVVGLALGRGTFLQLNWVDSALEALDSAGKALDRHLPEALITSEAEAYQYLWTSADTLIREIMGSEELRVALQNHVLGRLVSSTRFSK